MCNGSVGYLYVGASSSDSKDCTTRGRVSMELSTGKCCPGCAAWFAGAPKKEGSASCCCMPTLTIPDNRPEEACSASVSLCTIMHDNSAPVRRTHGYLMAGSRASRVVHAGGCTTAAAARCVARICNGSTALRASVAARASCSPDTSNSCRAVVNGVGVVGGTGTAPVLRGAHDVSVSGEWWLAHRLATRRKRRARRACNAWTASDVDRG